MTPEFKPNLNEAAASMQRLWNVEEPLDRVPAIIHLPQHPLSILDGLGRLTQRYRRRKRAASGPGV